MRTTLLFFGFSFILINGVFGQQSDCLREAQQKFDQGLLTNIPEQLGECLSPGNRKTEFTIKEEEIQAQKLLTKTYIYLDDQKNANQAILRLLKIDPEHEPEDDDPAEFLYLYNKYQSKPNFSVTIKLGGSSSFVNEGETFSLFNLDQSTREYTPTQTFPVLGVGFEYRFLKDLSVGTELRLANKEYDFQSVPYSTSLNTSDGISANFQQLNFTENQTYIEVPLYLKYSFGKNKVWVPYAYAGYEINYMIAAEIDQINRDIVGDFEAQGSDAPAIDILDNAEPLREEENYSALVGIGVKYRAFFRVDYLFLDIRYSQGLTNVVKASNRFDNDLAASLQNRFGYVDGNFKLNTLAVTFGFSKSFYKTKKLEGKKKKFLFFR